MAGRAPGRSEGSGPLENDGWRQHHLHGRRSTAVRVFVELSGEHPTLPRAEALAAMESERVEVRRMAFGPNLLRLEVTGPVERAAHRLGLAYVVCEELASGDLEAIPAFPAGKELGGRTFRVRAHGLWADMGPRRVRRPLRAEFRETGR